MKMIVLTRPGSNESRVAFLPTGGLVITESEQENTKKVRLFTAGVNMDVKELFDNIVENINANIEMWGR